MRFVSAAVVVCLIILTGDRSAARRRDQWHPRPELWGPPSSQALSRRAFTLRSRGRLPEAIEIYDRGYREAVARNDSAAAARFLVSRGGCELLLLRYRAALTSLNGARDIFLELGDSANAAATYADTSSVYLQIFDINSALQAAESALALTAPDAPPSYRAAILGQIASIHASAGDHRRAIEYFGQAIAAANDAATEAAQTERLGVEFQALGDLPRAESALDEAFRLRLLSKSQEIYFSYYSLAGLKLAQGETHMAARLIDRAIQTFQVGGARLPEYRVFYLRGQIRLANGNPQAALADFRRSLHLISQWRREVLPADAYRNTSTISLQQIYDSVIETTARLYVENHEQQYLDASWVASEANRAASLRETIAAEQSWRQRLPIHYWENLAQLRAVQSERLYSNASASPDARRRSELKVQRITTALAAMESDAHLNLNNEVDLSEKNLTRISLSHFRKVLGKCRTLISFHLSPVRSYRWVITNRRAELKELPGAKYITDLAHRYRSAIVDGDASADVLGRELYSVLFGGIDDERRPGTWLVALEGPLFEVPMSALVADERPKRTYLIQRHALQIVPGAWAVEDKRAGEIGSGFLGIGDAIYNTADSRWHGDRGSTGRPSAAFAFLRAGELDSTEALPRLPGSHQELDTCARQWGQSSSTLLEGAAANWQNLQKALQPRTGAIHIAAHFLRSSITGDPNFLALSLSTGARGSKPELVSAADISTLRAPDALVVLSGCASSTGTALPGAGLMSLGRAWLAAGASAVVGTLWPAPDDNGTIFASFYFYLGRAGSTSERLAPAEALRRAQLDMLRSRTWRSEPRFWASYQLTGRSYRNDDDESRSQRHQRN